MNEPAMSCACHCCETFDRRSSPTATAYFRKFRQPCRGFDLLAYIETYETRETGRCDDPGGLGQQGCLGPRVTCILNVTSIAVVSIISSVAKISPLVKVT